MKEDIWIANKQMKDTAFHGHSPSSKNDLAIGKLFHLLCFHKVPVATLLPKHWGKNNFFPTVPLILSHVKRQNYLHKKTTLFITGFMDFQYS